MCRQLGHYGRLQKLCVHLRRHCALLTMVGDRSERSNQSRRLCVCGRDVNGDSDSKTELKLESRDVATVYGITVKGETMTRCSVVG